METTRILLSPNSSFGRLQKFLNSRHVSSHLSSRTFTKRSSTRLKARSNSSKRRLIIYSKTKGFITSYKCLWLSSTTSMEQHLEVGHGDSNYSRYQISSRPSQPMVKITEPFLSLGRSGTNTHIQFSVQMRWSLTDPSPKYS